MKNLSPNEVLDLVQRVAAGESNPKVGNWFPKSTVKYVAGLTNAIEQNSLVLAKNSAAVGVTNIDKAQLDNPFVVTRIRAVFDTSTGVGVTAQTGNYKDPAPIYVANGEVEISQQSIGVVLDTPFSAICNISSATSTSNDDGFYKVVPFVLRPNIAIKIEPIFAGAAAANHAYRLELDGFELIADNRK